MTPQQIAALRAIGRTIIEVCADEPIGAPGGIIFAALQAQGCSLHQYEQIMSGLTRAGMLERDGDCYTATERGRAFAGLVTA